MATRRPLSDKNYEDRKPPARTTKKRQQFQTINKSSLLLILNDILKETAKVHGPLILCDEDLQRPDPERIQMTYLKLLNYCFNISSESLSQPPFNRTHEVEHPDLIEGFVYRIQFFRAMKRFMITCLVKDFSMSDLVSPEPKRTARNLSAIVNYIRFHLNVFNSDEETNSYLESKEVLKEELSGQKESVDGLQQELSRLRNQRAREYDMEEELKQTLISQHQAIQERQCERELLEREYQATCEQGVTIDQTLESLERESKKCLQRMDDLKKKVVTSPEKLRSRLTQLQRQVVEAVDRVKENEQLQVTWESLASLGQQVPGGVLKSLLENLDDLLDMGKRRDELALQCESKEEQIRRANQLLREATAKHQALLQHLKIVEEESARVTYRSGKVTRSQAVNDLQRDALLLKQELHQRETNDEEFRRKADKEQEMLSGEREHLEEASKETEEVASALMAAFHDKVGQYKDIMKKLDLDIF